MMCLQDGAEQEEIRLNVPAVAVTKGPKHHFFGYYDKHQFDRSGRYILGHELDIINRIQKPDDVVAIGMVDLEDNNKWDAHGRAHRE